LRIAQSGKFHTIGESLVLPSIKDAVGVMFGDKCLKEIELIPLSNDTVARRIEDMSRWMEYQLINRLDESTDVQGLSRLIVFIRFVWNNERHEDILFCEPIIRGTSEEIFETLDAYVKSKELDWRNCGSISTDGARAMCGKNSGVVTRILKQSPNALWTHCFFHSEALVSKTISDDLKNVLNTAVKIINFIKSKALQSCLFEKLCEEMGSGYKCLLLHSEVRWLSRGNVLTRHVELREEVQYFWKDKVITRKYIFEVKYLYLQGMDVVGIFLIMDSEDEFYPSVSGCKRQRISKEQSIQMRLVKKEKKLRKLIMEAEKMKKASSLKNSVETDDCESSVGRYSGRLYTVSIAIPGSIVENAQSFELRTYLAGQIARAASIFEVDEIIIFDETATMTSKEVEMFENGELRAFNCNCFLVRILRYIECPQYLRKHLFPLCSDFKYVGLLNPLDCFHHFRMDEVEIPYREAVVVNKPVKDGRGSFCNAGLAKDVEIDRTLKPGIRVTVKFENSDQKQKRLVAKVVNPTEPRTAMGYYWGYNVRLAKSLKSVFSDCPYVEGYDLIVGTSDKGTNVDNVQLPSFKHLLIVFGGVKGIEACIENDQHLQENDPESLFQFYLNTCPNQGSRTIRTEEAILITLSILRPKFNVNFNETECYQFILKQNSELAALENVDMNVVNKITDCFIRTGYEMLTMGMNFILTQLGLIYGKVEKSEHFSTLLEIKPATESWIFQAIHIGQVVKDDDTCYPEAKAETEYCLETLKNSLNDSRPKMLDIVEQIKQICIDSLETTEIQNLISDLAFLEKEAHKTMEQKAFVEQLYECGESHFTPQIQPLLDHILNNIVQSLSSMLQYDTIQNATLSSISSNSLFH
ncbi:Uncharacterized protein T08_959, partial [Trichinella sp. T8]